MSGASSIDAPVVPGGDPAFGEAYQRVMPELQALSLDELLRVNINVSSAVTTLLRVFPGIFAFAPRIARELPFFDLERLRKLRDYAMAASHAQTLYILALQRDDTVRVLVTEGTTLRATLFADASALVWRGLISPSRLKELRRRTGFGNLAFDLQFLAALLRPYVAPPDSHGTTGRHELQRAEIVAAGILQLARSSRGLPAGAKAAAKIRSRAFTLLHRAYDDARRVITYLRWNDGDVDTIAPSLYAGRGGRKRTNDGALPRAAPPITDTHDD